MNNGATSARGAARLEPVEFVVRPGAGPNAKPLVRITLPACRAGDPPIWGRPETLGGGVSYVRNRPTADGDPKEAA